MSQNDVCDCTSLTQEVSMQCALYTLAVYVKVQLSRTILGLICNRAFSTNVAYVHYSMCIRTYCTFRWTFLM